MVYRLKFCAIGNIKIENADNNIRIAALHFFLSAECKPTPKELLLELYETVPDKWLVLSIYLEVPGPQLKTIQEKYPRDPQTCLMTMLCKGWLPRVSPPPTWQELANSVEFVGCPDVAQRLRHKSCE